MADKKTGDKATYTLKEAAGAALAVVAPKSKRPKRSDFDSDEAFQIARNKYTDAKRKRLPKTKDEGAAAVKEAASGTEVIEERADPPLQLKKRKKDDE